VAITSSGLGHPDTLPVSTCDEAAPSTNNHNKQSAHHYQQQTENPKTATQSPTATSQDANDSLSSKHDSELIVSNPDPEAIEKAPRCIIRGLFQIQKVKLAMGLEPTATFLGKRCLVALKRKPT
jgi:hypothetical protein